MRTHRLFHGIPFPTAYGFSCGYVAIVEKENGNRKRLYQSEGIFHLVFRRSGHGGMFHWRSFDVLDDAIKAWKEVKI